MLFILTGDIQIGKTRWLQQLVSDLEAVGVTPYGVIAPGTWIEHGESDGTLSYEKTGIDNELLPSHERIAFARRQDLAREEGTYDEQSQAAQMKLSWAIDDNAIAAVNEHLEAVAKSTNGIDRAHGDAKPGLLVIDELGRLELLADGGLVSALALVDRGATTSLPHALIIVRDQLLETALQRFANAPWGGMTPIAPNAEAREALFAAYGM